MSKKTPSDFLRSVVGRPVIVKLNSGVSYRGVLACLDGYMNVALEQTEEWENGQLKTKYGDTFIRGNNILYISTQKRKAKPAAGAAGAGAGAGASTTKKMDEGED